MSFKKATRKGSKLVISVSGLSGSGKTYSAIQIASGLASSHDKIAFLDTENGRGALYSDIITPSFDIDDVYAPFTADAYINKIKEAEKAGYEVLIIDSASHEWDGLGGVIEQAGVIEARTKKSGLHCWNKPKAQHRRFVNELLQCKLDVIICLRAKEKFIQVKVNGRQEIVSTGLECIQERDFIYEMTISMMMDEETKTPKLKKCPEELRNIFPSGEYITPKCGKKLRAWVDGGVVVDEELEQLKIKCMNAALCGIEELKKHYMGLTNVEKAKVKPYMDSECKEVANRVPIDPSFIIHHPFEGDVEFITKQEAVDFLKASLAEFAEDGDDTSINQIKADNQEYIKEI